MLLERMNKGVSKILIQIFSLLLIASFGIWGIGDMTGVITSPGDIASVGGESITPQEFQQEFSRELNSARQRLGNLTIQQARSLGLAQTTLNRMIARRLLSLQANDLGLLISDRQIAELISNEPAFRNKQGQFDRTIYENLLANNGLTERTYVAEMRQETQQGYVARAISDGVDAPQSLVKAIFEYRNEKRTAEVINIKRLPISKAPHPTKADLTAYLKKHSDQFMAPEYRTMTALYLDPNQVAKELSPSPKRIEEEYKNELPSLSVPEKRDIEQMLFKSEKKAKAAYEALTEGHRFKAIAKDMAHESPAQMNLGLVSKSDLLPVLAGPTFSLKKGEFTKPIKSPLGWHIIKVTDIKPGHKPSLDEVRKKISNDVAHEMALNDIVRRANKVEDAIAGGATIEEAAHQVGAELEKVGPMDENAKLKAGTPIAGLPTTKKFIQTAFSLDKGATSRLLDTSNGGYFMVRVDNITPPAKQSLDQVHDAVEKAWKLEQLDAAAKKKAEEVRDAAKGGKSLKDIAAEKELSLETGKPFTRFASDSETFVPRELIPHLFDAKKGEIVMSQTADGFAVARLTGIERDEPKSGDEQYKRLSNELSVAISNDLLREYTQALHKEYSVSINQDAINSYFANQAQQE